MVLHMYGSRGTIPYSTKNNIDFGGNTSCVAVSTMDEKLILDCGSGLYSLGADLKKQGDSPVKLHIFISHLHLDHIIGLSTFSPLWDEKNDITIYTKSRGKATLCEQVFGAFKPPYWPVDLSKMYKGKLVEIHSGVPVKIGEHITVEAFDAVHEDDTTAFQISSDEGKSVVYMLDYELDKDYTKIDQLINYCKDADAVIFDSSYLPEDYEHKMDWGHSTYEAGMMLAQKSGCKRMIFSHLSQDYSDELLYNIQKKIQGMNETYFFAYDGMEFKL